jgi:hypothetical protein
MQPYSDPFFTFLFTRVSITLRRLPALSSLLNVKCLDLTPFFPFKERRFLNRRGCLESIPPSVILAHKETDSMYKVKIRPHFPPMP